PGVAVGSVDGPEPFAGRMAGDRRVELGQVRLVDRLDRWREDGGLATSGRGLRGPGGAGRRGRAASAGTPRGPAPAPPRRPRLGPAGSRRRLTAPGGHRLAVDVVLGGSPRDEDLLSTARAGADEVHLAPSHDPLGGAPALVDDIREAVRVVGIFEVFRGERHWLACLVAVAASSGTDCGVGLVLSGSPLRCLGAMVAPKTGG